MTLVRTGASADLEPMPTDSDHARRQQDAATREARRSLVRAMAAVIAGFVVLTLFIIGVLTWLGQR